MWYIWPSGHIPWGIWHIHGTLWPLGHCTVYTPGYMTLGYCTLTTASETMLSWLWNPKAACCAKMVYDIKVQGPNITKSYNLGIWYIEKCSFLLFFKLIE